MVVTRSESRKHLTEVNEPVPQPEENAEKDMLPRPRCEICNKTYTRKTDVNRHFDGHHAGLTHNCTYPECGYVGYTKDNLKKHLEKHFPDKRFQCDFCKKRFQKSAQLRDHRIKQHNIKTHSYNTKGRGAQKSTNPKVPVARKKAGKPKPQPKQASRPRQTKVYNLRERDLPMVHEPSPSPEDIVAAERHAEAAEALFLLKMGATVPA